MSQFFQALERADRERNGERAESDRQRTSARDEPLPPAVEDDAETFPLPQPVTATVAAPPRVEAPPRPAAPPLPEAPPPVAPPRPDAATPAPPPRPETIAPAAPPRPEPVPSSFVAPRRTVVPPPETFPEEQPRGPANAPSTWPSSRPAHRAVRVVQRAGKASKERIRPVLSREKAPVLVTDVDPNSVAAEAYRALRVNIEFMPQGVKCRNIVITSPSQGEGKSTTAANLAVVSAQAGWRVCLVEADFRRPMLHTAFGLPNRGGLVKALMEELPLSGVALPTEFPGLSLVVAGDYDPAQTDLLNSSRIQQVRQGLESHYDLVLWDTPPILLVADAINLVAQSDGVILVVRSGAIPSSVLRRASRQIGQVNGKILGVLLNRVDLRRNDQEFHPYAHAYHKSGSDA
jgi:capsular exopolysaccharide synthesis family protein